MDAKTIRQRYGENQDFIISNYLSNILVKYKGKDGNFIMENQGRSHLDYVIKFNNVSYYEPPDMMH